MKKVLAKIKLYSLVLMSLCAVTFYSCGDDDKSDYDPNNSGNTGGNTGGGNTGGSSINLVGKTYRCDLVEDSKNPGKQNTSALTLKFTSSSSYSISKENWYWKWENMAYRQFHFTGTKYSTYKINGSKIELKGYDPFWLIYEPERWRDNEDWTLEIVNANILADEWDDDKVFTIIR